MNTRPNETNMLYSLLERGVGALPAGAQLSAQTKLDGLKAATAHADVSYARIAETAQRQAAAKPAADAALKNAMQIKILGMKPTTAIVGAVAVGGLAIAATKLMRSSSEKSDESSWASRITHERAQIANHGLQR